MLVMWYLLSGFTWLNKKPPLALSSMLTLWCGLLSLLLLHHSKRSHECGRYIHLLCLSQKARYGCVHLPHQSKSIFVFHTGSISAFCQPSFPFLSFILLLCFCAPGWCQRRSKLCVKGVRFGVSSSSLVSNSLTSVCQVRAWWQIPVWGSLRKVWCCYVNKLRPMLLWRISIVIMRK